MMRLALSATLVCVLLAPAARAAMFEGLFAFADKVVPSGRAEAGGDFSGDLPSLGPRSDAGVCIAAIRQAEAAHGIPTDLLLAIGLQEAGMSYKGSMTIWPWSLNVEGEGFRFDSRAEAEAFLSDELAAGRRSIDVGCLQINLRWHPDAFPSPEAGFDPARNADYAARFLRGLHAETGDWLQAAGRYHSATPELKDIYLAGIEGHLGRLDRDAGDFDALASEVPAHRGGGIVLAAGVRLDAPAGRRLNPLRAPVRQAVTRATAGGVYRRTLLEPPRVPDAAAVPEGDDTEVGAFLNGGSFAERPAPPVEITRTPGRDGLFP